MTTGANDWRCLHPQANTADNVAITPNNRGLSYADGFFTTMGVIDGAILWQDYHQQRLRTHAHALQLNIDSETLLASLQASAKQLQQGVMKLIVTRALQAVGGYGFTPDASGSRCEVWLKSSAMAINAPAHVRLPDGRTVFMQPAVSAACLTAQLACLPPTLAGLKSLSRLDNVLASGELQCIKAAHTDISTGLGEVLGEGLVRDMTGNWVEGTMSNVFHQLAEPQLKSEQQPLSSPSSRNDASANYLLDGQWYTPPMTQSGVAGVQRQVLIDALFMTEYPVKMRVLSDDDLANVSQLFFCNAVRGIMPVTALTLLAGDRICFSV